MKDIILEFNSLDDAPPIILNFYDTDDGWFDSTDDYMGRSIVFLKDIEDLSIDDRIPKPVWYSVKFAMNDAFDKENGSQLLASFALMDFHEEFHFEPEDIELDMKMALRQENENDEIQYLDMPDLDI